MQRKQPHCVKLRKSLRASSTDIWTCLSQCMKIQQQGCRELVFSPSYADNGTITALGYYLLYIPGRVRIAAVLWRR
jgi:hypothetical protein